MLNVVILNVVAPTVPLFAKFFFFQTPVRSSLEAQKYEILSCGIFYTPTHYCEVTKFYKSSIEFFNSKGWYRIISPVWTSGIYYKHITIINDASRVVNEGCHNLELQCRVVNVDLGGVIYSYL